MLKIRDEVDLKELEKFGLKERDEFGVINYYYRKDDKELWISNQRFICIGIDCIGSNYETIPEELFNLLYDLIKADLVVKVGDDNE